jgi:hypothetical protein
MTARRKQLCSASIDGTTQSTQNVIFYLKNKLEKNVLEKENEKKSTKKNPFFKGFLNFLFPHNQTLTSWSYQPKLSSSA